MKSTIFLYTSNKKFGKEIKVITLIVAYNPLSPKMYLLIDDQDLYTENCNVLSKEMDKGIINR